MQRPETAVHPPAPQRPRVRCGKCQRAVFDGAAVRARVVVVAEDGSVRAKCQCKGWVRLPLTYTADD